jgi:hypothetical protein
MTRKTLDEMAGELDVMLTVMDGYDDCIEGVVERFNLPPIVCYNKTKIIRKLMKDNMTEEAAHEFYEFNQIGAWVGENTPCFITK